MPLADFQKTMQMFEQNMTANNIKQEMMNDAMDAAFEGDDDEEATYVTIFLFISSVKLFSFI